MAGPSFPRESGRSLAEGKLHLKILDEISQSEHEQGRPMLPAVVIVNGRDVPGYGFFTLAGKLARETSTGSLPDHEHSQTARLWESESSVQLLVPADLTYRCIVCFNRHYGSLQALWEIHNSARRTRRERQPRTLQAVGSILRLVSSQDSSSAEADSRSATRRLISAAAAKRHLGLPGRRDLLEVPRQARDRPCRSRRSASASTSLWLSSSDSTLRLMRWHDKNLPWSGGLSSYEARPMCCPVIANIGRRRRGGRRRRS